MSHAMMPWSVMAEYAWGHHDVQWESSTRVVIPEDGPGLAERPPRHAGLGSGPRQTPVDAALRRMARGRPVHRYRKDKVGT